MILWLPIPYDDGSPNPANRTLLVIPAVFGLLDCQKVQLDWAKTGKDTLIVFAILRA